MNNDNNWDTHKERQARVCGEHAPLHGINTHTAYVAPGRKNSTRHPAL